MVNIDDFLRFIRENLFGLILGAVSFVAISLAKYLREQVRAALNWILKPLTSWLPWNAIDQRAGAARSPSLKSSYSLIEVDILDSSGTVAIYKKTSSYEVVTDNIDCYREGVSAEGYATCFSTMRGSILSTENEHGFYLSTIALGTGLKRGSRFTNVYAARLRNCFERNTEHWTQEFAFQTARATIQVQFPRQRPPLSLSCKELRGTLEVELPNTASVVQLFGRPCAVWEIENPGQNLIVKLEWKW